MFIIKSIAIVVLLLCTFGCQHQQEYATHGEYTEKFKWEPERGLIESSEAIAKISW